MPTDTANRHASIVINGTIRGLATDAWQARAPTCKEVEHAVVHSAQQRDKELRDDEGEEHVDAQVP